MNAGMERRNRKGPCRAARLEALEQRRLLGAGSASAEEPSGDGDRPGTEGPMWRDMVDDDALPPPVLDRAASPVLPSSYATMIDNGPSANRVDVVFLGDGYTAAEIQTTYVDHISAMVDYLFGQNQDPLPRYRKFFNVHRLDLVSEESGADVPPEGIFRNTALDATYYADGSTERLLYINHSKAAAALDAGLAGAGFTAEMRPITVNDTKYGGGGGWFAVYAGGNPIASDIALHELGHSFGGLADEYDYGGSSVYAGPEPSQPNATRSPTGDKWAPWLGYADPTGSAVGAYEGALYSQFGVYRPTRDSKMRSLGMAFNAVSREAIIREIYDLVDPLDDWRPSQAPIHEEDPELWVRVVDPDVISVEWKVDGSVVSGATGPSLRLADYGFLSGTHAVTARAYDATDWVRGDRSALEQTIAWDVTLDRLTPQDDEFTTSEDVLLSVPVPGLLANDFSPDLSSLRVIGVDTTGILGTLVSWNADGSFVYQPPPEYSSTAGQSPDRFDYLVTDSRGGTATARVTIAIVEVNDPPTLDAIADPPPLPDGVAPQTLVLTGISAGPNETQDLRLAAISSDPELVPDPVVVFDPGGGAATLTFAPAAGRAGVADIAVTVFDSGEDGIPATSDDGAFSRSFVVTIFGVSALGAVDSQTQAGQDPGSRDLWYRLESRYDGFLTAEARVTGQGEARLSLYDAGFNHLLDCAADPSDSHRRLDYSGDAGKVYFLRLSGTAAQVDLQLTNLVQQSGSDVTVRGTDAEDRFEFSARSRVLKVRGARYDFSRQGATRFTFAGGGAADTAVLSGTPQSETASLAPGSGDYRGNGFTVTLDDIENITISSGGGDDVGEMYGQTTGEADRVRIDSTVAAMSGSGYSNVLRAYSGITAYGNGGGMDEAALYDSDQSDAFVADPAGASLSHPGFTALVRDFRYVRAIGNHESDDSGSDTALLYGQAGRKDLLAARPSDFALTDQATYYLLARGFDSATATANDSDDEVRFYDSAGSDTLYAYPTYASMTGAAYDHRAIGFGRVLAYATTPNVEDALDQANLYDSTGSDSLRAYPEYAYLTGTGFYSYARGFDKVSAYATMASAAGALDRAYLFDSAGSDALYAFPKYAYLTGTGFFNYAAGFDRVLAYATAANAPGVLDRAYLYDSSGSDTLVALPEYAYLMGTGFYNYARGFDKVFAYANTTNAPGATDRAVLYDSSGDDTFVGRAGYGYLIGPGFFNDAIGFDRVTACGTKGGTNRLNLAELAYVFATTGEWL